MIYKIIQMISGLFLGYVIGRWLWKKQLGRSWREIGTHMKEARTLRGCSLASLALIYRITQARLAMMERGEIEYPIELMRRFERYCLVENGIEDWLREKNGR